MKTQLTRLERRIRIAGIIISLGLLVEAISLRWSHPTAFLFFMIIGGSLIGAGILLYLYSITGQKDDLSNERNMPKHFGQGM